MIKRSNGPADSVKVTFVVSAEQCDQPVSVVGDFNGWDPLAHPMPPRSNGRRSIKVPFPAGSTVTFRYLSEGGAFADDPDGDVVDNGWGATHTVLAIPG